MSLAVVIPIWANRLELRKTLSANWQTFGAYADELILSSDTASGAVIEDIVRELAVQKEAANFAVYISESDGDAFKTKLLNRGAATSDCDTLLFCDGDVIVPAATLIAMLDCVGQKRVAFVKEVVRASSSVKAPASYLASYRDLVEIQGDDGVRVLIEKSAIYPNRHSRSGPGIVCLSHRLFDEISGYNEDLTGYGWEDIDLLVRASLFLGTDPVGVGCVHDVGPAGSRENLDARLLSESRNFQLSLADYCLGQFRGSLDLAAVPPRRRVRVGDE